MTGPGPRATAHPVPVALGDPVNRAGVTGAPVAFDGTKQSGLGREGARHGIEAFTDLKYVCLDLG